MAAKGISETIPIDLPRDWCGYVDEPMTEKEIGGLRESVRRQSPYGDSVWQEKMCGELGLESALRRRGRPMKRVNEEK
jgi:hypothetical protein